MKREEKIATMIKELIDTVAEREVKECATLVLSSYETEDKEKVGQTIAAHGNPVAICAILMQAMQENELLKASIKMASRMYDLVGTDKGSAFDNY